MIRAINNNKWIRLIILLCITCLACVPLFVQGIEGHFGQDLGFHLNRIEGIVTELKAGHFPVKMESNWMNGYGYPAPIYYGDVLLYIPALLRLMGIGVVTSYKIFVFLITFATALLTYLCFKKIAGRKDIALACSLIYTCASYRIENVYIRGAVGEYCAMVFFPIIMLAMHTIYTEGKDISIKKMFVNATVLTLGLSGLINTHMLSTEMVGIVLIVFCLINFKKTFTKPVLLTGVIAAIETVIVNLFYLVPFIDYFIHESVNINNTVGNARMIQHSGLHIWEFVSFFKMPFANIGGISDDRLLLTPGIVCILILIVGIIFWFRGKTDRQMKITIISVIILMFVSSCYFPWDFLAQRTHIGNFLAQVQFPWRYMGIIIALLTLLGSALFIRMGEGKMVIVSYLIIIVCSVVTMAWFTYEYKTYGKLETFTEAEELDSSDMGFVEYLRTGTEREQFTGEPSSTNDATVNLIKRNGTDREYEIKTGLENVTVTLPIVNYKGYRITDEAGREYSITDGDNNLISFEVEPNFTGKIYLQFVQPIYWIIAEIISLIAAVVIIIGYILIVRKKKESKTS